MLATLPLQTPWIFAPVCVLILPKFDIVYPHWTIICAADGESLIALRYRNHPTEQPPSLYVSFTAAGSLNRKYRKDSTETGSPAHEIIGSAGAASELELEAIPPNPHGPHVIVASEPASESLGLFTAHYRLTLPLIYSVHQTWMVGAAEERNYHGRYCKRRDESKIWRNEDIRLKFGLIMCIPYPVRTSCRIFRNVTTT